MILSLLVGSLLVGRQIVDRAKIQRIIFEFDYYEKAFHQFYDTYKVVPGNLDYKTCIKYSEFVGKDVGRNWLSVEQQRAIKSMLTHEQWCNKYAIVKNGSNRKVILSEYYSSVYTLTQMKVAGFVSEENMPTYSPYFADLNLNEVHRRLDKGQGSFAKTTFNTNGEIQIVGFHPINVNGTAYPSTDIGYGYIQRAWYLSIYGYQKEFTNSTYNSYLDDHNAINMMSNTIGTGGVHGENSLLSSKMMSELDAKIDDGRPGTGKLLALKGYRATVDGATNAQIENTCYDKPFEDVNIALYHNSNNLEYGCNLIKVMEDVK